MTSVLAANYEGTDVGKNVLKTLYKHHLLKRRKVWCETHGRLIDILQTPYVEYWGEEQPPDGHADTFPLKMKELIVQAKHYVDITSLSPPDGMFSQAIQEALKELGESKKEIKVRMMFGNIIGMGVDTTAVLKELTQLIPEGHNLNVWVGAYRNGPTSWNHSKIIAVDSRRLIMGGHNLWTDHYLKFNPVHDISLHLRGRIAVMGHLYANEHWKWAIHRLKTGLILSVVPECCFSFCVLPNRVTIARFPDSAPTYPSCWDNESTQEKLHGKLPWLFKRPEEQHIDAPENEIAPTNCAKKLEKLKKLKHPDAVPMIAVGRQGAIGTNPSDDAFVAMLAASTQVIRISQQDIGPFCIPGTRYGIPGGQWPMPYLTEIAKALLRDVHVYIVLSNPFSIPSVCTMTEANYGNGWHTEDVAAKIVQVAMDIDSDEQKVRIAMDKYLHVSMVKCKKNVDTYAANHGVPEDKHIGNHAKFFMVDDKAFYVGSQNFYVCNLAEWGVIVDHEGAANRMKEEYWNNLWEHCEWAEKDTAPIFDQKLYDHEVLKEAEVTDESKKQMAEALMRHGNHHEHNIPDAADIKEINDV